MKMSNNFSEDFEKLILNKSFSELSPEELNSLETNGISEEEYKNVQQMLKAMSELEEEEIQPSSALRDKLMDSFNHPSKQSGKIISLQTWIISGLSAAALITLVFFLFKPEFSPRSNTTKLSDQVINSDKQLEKETPFSQLSDEQIESTLNAPSPSVQTVEEVSAIQEIKENSSLPMAQESDMPEETGQENSLNSMDSRLKTSEIEIEKKEQAEDIPAAAGKSAPVKSVSINLDQTSSVVSNKEMLISKNKKGSVKKSDSMKNHKDLFASIVTVY
jgi:hypothetical protein